MWTTETRRSTNDSNNDRLNDSNNERLYKKKVTLYLDDDILDSIDIMAKENERHRSQQIRFLLKSVL